MSEFVGGVKEEQPSEHSEEGALRFASVSTAPKGLVIPTVYLIHQLLVKDFAFLIKR